MKRMAKKIEEYSQDDPRRCLLIKEKWFEKGTYLWLLANSLREIGSLPEVGVTIVGGVPVSNTALVTGDGRDMNSHNREIMAAMVFAFAVECWLKGILVARVDRSKSMRDGQLLTERLEEILKTTDVQELSDETAEFWLSVFRHPDVSDLSKRHSASIRAEDVDRQEALQPHGRHLLVDLASTVDLPDIEKHKEYLKFLSAANMLGRYPAHRVKEANLSWDDGRAVDKVRWDSLNESILKAYDLLVNQELGGCDPS